MTQFTVDVISETVSVVFDVSLVDNCYNCPFFIDEEDECRIGETFDCPITEIISGEHKEGKE